MERIGLEQYLGRGVSVFFEEDQNLLQRNGVLYGVGSSEIIVLSSSHRMEAFSFSHIIRIEIR